MLDEEEREDKAMKDRFKQKWNRTESGKLTESLRAEVTKFQGIVDTATKVHKQNSIYMYMYIM